MAASRFHLGWFLNFVPDAWNETWGAGGSPWDGRFYIEMAQALERACFDYVILEDKLRAHAHDLHVRAIQRQPSGVLSHG